MLNGEICTINDLITYNLNITQFARNVITTCEEPGLLRAFYDTIEQITVLDPTCGSGAFLFAALNILKPLYQACIERMRLLVTQYKVQRKESNHITYFQKILDRVDQHHSQEYFILKTIIINNLYGVDIMEEAIEICKLRLFLKLVAQIDKPNDLEPLPDIDFNVLAGNTLIGFTSLDEVRRVVTTKLVNMDDAEKTLQLIEQDAQDIERDEQSFRSIQTMQGMEIDSALISDYKHKLREKLKNLRGKLDPYLATEYAIYESKYPDRDAYEKAYTQWQKSHKPFHWWAEVYRIIQDGGFDVIIGNPPYVEYKDIKSVYTLNNLETLSCGDLYAYAVESSYKIIKQNGHIGLIVPISIFGTDGFNSLQSLSRRSLEAMWISCFANRPAQLFDGAQKRLTILLGKRGSSEKPHLYTTTYIRWLKEERDTLFAKRMQYVKRSNSFQVLPASLEKLGSDLEIRAFSRLLSIHRKLGLDIINSASTCVYYTRKFGYFLAFLDFVPRITDLKTGLLKQPSELKTLGLRSSNLVNIAIAALSSSTFFWFWNVLSDCRNLNRRDLLAFPLSPDSLSDEVSKYLSSLGKQYIAALHATSLVMLKSGMHIETFDYASCKPIIDEIDCVLAQHYGFTPEELDFIINYDIKYRMGRDNGEESEE